MFNLRKLVQSSLSSDSELQELAAPNELVVFQRTGLEETVPPKTRPFILHTLGMTTPSGIRAIRAHNQYLTIWVHDDTGDYFRIDSIHARVKLVLEGLEPREQFYEMRMLDRSPDLSDLGLDTNVRYATYLVALSPGGL